MEIKLEAPFQYPAVSNDMISSEEIAQRKGIITYQIYVGCADPSEHHLRFAQVNRRVMTAVELQSTHADALPSYNHIVRYYMFLSTHVLHTSW